MSRTLISRPNVEKLVRFVRDLYLLSINFVNFKDLYDAGEPAVSRSISQPS